MSKKKNKLVLNLKFAQFKCDGCGDLRGAGVACRICQTKAGKNEFDRHVEQRKNVLKHVNRSVEVPIGFGCELDAAYNDIKRWYASGLRALDKIANGGKELKPLNEAYAALEWHAKTWKGYALRPHVMTPRNLNLLSSHS